MTNNILACEIQIFIVIVQSDKPTSLIHVSPWPLRNLIRDTMDGIFYHKTWKVACK